jgi:hypothetical protein
MATNWFRILTVFSSLSLIVNLVFAGICYKSANDIQEINSAVQKMLDE